MPRPLNGLLRPFANPAVNKPCNLKLPNRPFNAYSKVAADATTTLIVPSNMTEVADPDWLGHENDTTAQIALTLAHDKTTGPKKTCARRRIFSISLAEQASASAILLLISTNFALCCRMT
jgi:hypothetical protein